MAGILRRNREDHKDGRIEYRGQSSANWRCREEEDVRHLNNLRRENKAERHKKEKLIVESTSSLPRIPEQEEENEKS